MSTEIEIRRARLADAAALANLRLATWRETYPVILPDAVLTAMSAERQRVRLSDSIASVSPDIAVFCAQVGGVLAAYGLCGPARSGPDGFGGEVQELYVLSDYYGQGIGRAMMARMAMWLASRGYNSLFAAVLQQNHGARAFYRRLGGERCGEGKIVMGGRELIQEAFGWRDLAVLTGSPTDASGRLYPVLRRPDDEG